MTKRYKVTLAYDGANFAGFQRQPNQRTIEGVLTKAVNKMAKNPSNAIIIYGSGRTDSGVHALGQVIHFDFPFCISEINMLKGLNSLLPLEIQIKKVQIVPSTFHARFDVTSKKYVYRFDLSKFVDPFKRKYTAHWKYPIDINRIKVALSDLIGEHDFSSFVASGSHVKSNVRNIYSANCYQDKNKNEIVFEFHGNGFLYNMVRIMVGVLMEIGMGKRKTHDIIRLFNLKDRSQAPYTSPANGLYLKEVQYDDKKV